MRILVTGANGQVGRELARYGQQAGHELIATTRVELDITNRQAIKESLAQYKPQLLINAAAYTAVDKAEQEPAQAFLINRDGAGQLAQACADQQIPLLHISTDYVFDGHQSQPYQESDPVAPLGVYGESKWQGEQQIRHVCPQHIILRTSWVFGEYGQNFVRTMLRLAQERDELRVVADQQGCPTSAAGIARCLLGISEQLAEPTAFSSRSVFGTYHYCGSPASNWHDFAEAIVSTAQDFIPLRTQGIVPISTADFPTPAARPANSVLDCQRLARVFGIQAEPWHEGLRDVLSAWLRPDNAEN
jgi:dTDP-4-dehydrorhamnose reductase